MILGSITTGIASLITTLEDTMGGMLGSILGGGKG